MATVEELLVSIGIDPASVSKFLDDVDRIKNEAGDEPVKIEVRSNADRALAQTVAQTQRLGREATQATSAFRTGLTQVGDAARELRLGLLAVSAAVGFGLSRALGSAVEESRNLANANVILRVSSERLTEIQADLRKVADETGLTFQQVSATLFDVASAGFQAEAALEVTSVAAKVAAASGGDVNVAFNAIATAMENFGFSAEEAGDRLVRTADVSRATLSGIADALATVGPLAGQFGISFDEVAAALSRLTVAGNNTSISATLLNGVISAIITPADEAVAAFKKLNITVGATAFQNQTLVEIFQKIQTEAKAAGVELTDLFSDRRALRGAAALLADTDALAKVVEEVGDASGRTAEALKDFFAQAGPQVDRLVSTFNNLLTVIGADFLNALLPTIRLLTTFIIDNKELIAVVVELSVGFGALVIGIVAFEFITRQAGAVSRLLLGTLSTLTGIIEGTTAAFETDTKAVLANAAVKKQSAAATAFLNFFSSIRTLLVTETGLLFANSAAWVKNAVARTVSVIRTVAEFLLISAVRIVGETIALIANTKALAANAIGRRAVLSFATPLTSALVANVGALGLGTVALGVFSAALVGLGVGTVINRVFGLSDAFGKFARTGTRSVRSVIAEFAIFLNPITAAIRGVQLLEVASVRSASAQLTAAQKTFLALDKNKDILDEVARIQRQNAGLSKKDALAQALNESARIAFLRRLKTANKASATDIAELARQERDLAKAIAETETELGKLSRAVQNRARLQDQLKANEKDLAKVIRATNKEIIAVRRGSEAAAQAGARATFEARLVVLRRQANIERALAVTTQEEIDKVRAETGDTGLGGLVAQLEADQAKVAVTLNRVALQFEIFSRRITAEGQKRLTALNQQAEQEIASARKVADVIIGEERRKADAAAREIENLRDARDRGIQDATAFLDRLRQEAIARIDPALAELRRFERQALEGLTGATAAQAEASIGFIVQRLKELAAATSEEVRVQAELNRLRESETGEESEAQIERTLRREEVLQERLSELQKLRAVRALAAAKAEEALAEKAEGAADRQEATTKKIETEQQIIIRSNEEIADIKDKLAAKERVIQTELARTIRLTNILTQANLEALRISTALAVAVGKVGPDAASAKSLEVELAKAAQRVKALERATAEELRVRDETQRAAEESAKKAFDALAEQTKLSQERDRQTAAAAAALVPLANEAGRLTAVAAESTETLSSSVDSVLKEQAALGKTVTTMATTVTSKLQEVGAEFVRQDQRLGVIERELEGVRIAPDDERSGGGL